MATASVKKVALNVDAAHIYCSPRGKGGGTFAQNQATASAITAVTKRSR